MDKLKKKIKKWLVTIAAIGAIGALIFFVIVLAGIIAMIGGSQGDEGQEVGGLISIKGFIKGEEAEFTISGAVNVENLKTPDTVSLQGNEIRIEYEGEGKTVSTEGLETFRPTEKQLKLATKVFTRLCNEGFSEAAACGILGNIQRESGFEPSAIEGGSGIGAGLIQWSYGRRDNLESFAKEQGKSWKDVEVQTDFLLHELSTEGSWKMQLSNCHSVGISNLYCDTVGYEHEGWTLADFKTCSDVKQATSIFCNHFERPGVVELNQRIDYAVGYFAALSSDYVRPVKVALQGELNSNESKCTFTGKINGVALETVGSVKAEDGKTIISTRGYWGEPDNNVNGSAAIDTVTQQKIVQYATSQNSFGTSPGYCQAWVAFVYEAATGILKSDCCAKKCRDTWATNTGEIPVGAAIYSSDKYVSGVTCGCGRNAGHVGIYVGNDEVVSMLNSGPSVQSLKSWNDWFGYGGWSWNGLTQEQIQ